MAILKNPFKIYRENNNLKIAEVANLLNVSPQRIYQLEGAIETRPSLKLIEKLSELSGQTAEEIVDFFEKTEEGIFSETTNRKIKKSYVRPPAVQKMFGNNNSVIDDVETVYAFLGVLFKKRKRSIKRRWKVKNDGI